MPERPRFEVGDPVDFPLSTSPLGIDRGRGQVIGVIRGEGCDTVVIVITNGPRKGQRAIDMIIDGFSPNIRKINYSDPEATNA
jgi:hypothetical protein